MAVRSYLPKTRVNSKLIIGDWWIQDQMALAKPTLFPA